MKITNVFVSVLVILSTILVACGASTPIAATKPVVPSPTPTRDPLLDEPTLRDWTPGESISANAENSCQVPGTLHFQDGPVRYDCLKVLEQLQAEYQASLAGVAECKFQPVVIADFTAPPQDLSIGGWSDVRLVIFTPRIGVKQVSYLIPPGGQAKWHGWASSWATTLPCNEEAWLHKALDEMDPSSHSGMIVQAQIGSANWSIIRAEYPLSLGDRASILARHEAAMELIPE